MTLTIRNKNVISITVKRADYENKTPDYPGNQRELDQHDEIQQIKFPHRILDY